MRKTSIWLKRSLLALTLLISTAIIIQSCKKEVGFSKGESSLTVDELKNWFTNNQLTIAPRNKAFADLKPDFATATQSIKDGMRVLEVNFDADNRLAIGENIGNDNQRAAIQARTQTKLILLNKIGTPEVMGAYMVLNGQGSEDLNKVHYKDFNGYSGTMMFFNLDGSFSNGYIIANGKITRTLRIAEKKKEVLSIADGLAGKVIKENTKKGERLMLADYNTLDCNIATYDVYQQHCFTFDLSPALIAQPKTQSIAKPGNKLMASQTFCEWVHIGTIEILNCAPTLLGSGDDGYIPTGGSNSGGGNGSPSATNKIITTDISITRNEKAKCALDKMLNQNKKFDSLLKAFTGKGYDLTFKVMDLSASDTLRGRTTYDPVKKQNFFIILNKKFVDNAPPIHIAKTLLHEAFHANLMQRAYEVFGSATINNSWSKKPEDMTLKELMDIFESKVNGTALEDVHHQYIAKHVNDLVSGLKEFAQKYDENYNNYDEYDYLGLAWEGLRETSYFKENVKHTQIYYVPNTTAHLRADSLFDTRTAPMLNNSKVNCGLPTVE